MADSGPSKTQRRQRNIRQKAALSEDDDKDQAGTSGREGEQTEADIQRDKLEEIKLLQKLRKKSGGTTADALAAGAKDEILTAPRADSEERQLPTELMDTFSKAKVVVADTDEDPHMKKFIEQELAKRLGKSIDSHENEDPETRRKRLEAEMYQIPDEYKTTLQPDMVIPGMNMVITEVGISAAQKLRNIEQVEEMKKRMLGGGLDDDGPGDRSGKVRRGQFAVSFGKQRERKDMSREELESEHKRMKYVSESKPALPKHKMQQH